MCTRGDIDRIIAHIRALEVARLGPSVKSKVRLMGLMQQVGVTTYADLVRMREEEKRKKEEERAKRPPVRRARLPRFKPKSGAPTIQKRKLTPPIQPEDPTKS